MRMADFEERWFVVLQVLQGRMSKRYRLLENLQKEVCLLRVFEGFLPRLGAQSSSRPKVSVVLEE